MKVRAEPKYYSGVCESMPDSYSNYDEFTISWGSLDHYAVIKKLGGGRYSEAYEAINTANNQNCVIKILKPRERYTIKREVLILQALHNGPNIVKLYDVIKDPDTKIASLVFKSVSGDELEKVKLELTDYEVRYYLYELLRALDYCNSRGIMHRDIKPENIIINRETKSMNLIDWGLAEFYFAEDEMSLSISTLNYKAPEILINDGYYHYSVDMWSLGCTFAEMLFKKEIFLNGNSKPDQLVKIAKLCGSEELFKVINKYELEPDKDYIERIKNFPKQPLTKFINKNNTELVNDHALDLLEKMLTYDKNERITAKDAMQHPYFDPVLEMTGLITK